MKKSSTIHSTLIAGLALASLTCLPMAQAQTVPPASPQDSKIDDNSTAQKHATPTESSSAQDRLNSKDTTTSLDKNPSTAGTNSAEKSATKDPTGAPGSPNETATSRTESNSDKTASSQKVSDQEFITKAAEGGMTEVELGKLAAEKATSPQVKEFGSKMVTDHSQADTELKAIAQKKGITVPDQLNPKGRATVDHFRTLSGAAFDKAYVHAMVKDHEKDAAEFRQASTSADDADVKAFASNTLKMIDTHLADIKSIQSNLK